MIDNVILNGETRAIILRNDFEKNGIHFFTPNESSQQLGYMKRPKGYIIPPHEHREVVREISKTQETLFVKSGIIQANFYDDDHKLFSIKILRKGDVVLLVSGGHGFEFLEEGEIIEVKQGPYLDKDDKVLL